ncbi:hypothetical protein DFH11DRAFT_1512774 [Phellopilus nigrolimitatus]|nr:hypothetical protein DFH11DRAFT_1512774 [Phellopilus nigrolimitatus]
MKGHSFTNQPSDFGSLLTPPMILAEADNAFAEKLPEQLWYLAYGSNLNSHVFKSRRGISPLAQKNILVEGLELTFDLPGIPYLEPRFANCRFASSAPLYSGSVESYTGKSADRLEYNFDLDALWTGAGALVGVAYLVTPEGFARVLATEGGGSAYKMVAVQGRVIAPEGSSAVDVLPTMKLGPAFTGEIIHAFTLLASAEQTRQTDGEPSSRYLSLVRKGAEECALPTTYRTYLAELTSYRPTTLRQKTGRALILAMWMPAIIAFMLLGCLFAGQDGNYPTWVNNTKDRLFGTMWGSYDSAWKVYFGDGERTINTRRDVLA